MAILVLVGLIFLPVSDNVRSVIQGFIEFVLIERGLTDFMIFPQAKREETDY